MMRKVYDEEKTSKCPFCSDSAITKNVQGVPVCLKHKDILLDDLKCLCGEYLEVMNGKYGPFFKCINCNIISFNKALEVNGYPLKSIYDL